MPLPKPKLIIACVDGQVCITGWEELDRWAIHNNPRWNGISYECMRLGLSETDRMRILAGAFLDESETFKQQFLKAVDRACLETVERLKEEYP